MSAACETSAIRRCAGVEPPNRIRSEMVWPVSPRSMWGGKCVGEREARHQCREDDVCDVSVDLVQLGSW